jgi:predicted nucleic acid-binding protein
MILVDTNVISEPTKPTPNLRVLAWLDRQPRETLFLAATSFAESLAGIASLPVGRRRQDLSDTFDALIHKLFSNRILSFDDQSAVAYASVIADARVRGYTISIADGQIAAIASVHGFTVATRDVAPFLAAGIPVLNPWEL